MKLDFKTGILTSFLLPTGVKQDAYNAIYRSGSFYTFVRAFAFFGDFAWVFATIFFLFGNLGGSLYIKVTVVVFIFEMIYKLAHHKYKYF